MRVTIEQVGWGFEDRVREPPKSFFFFFFPKPHEPVGRVQFVVFEQFISAHLFQIAQEKS